MKITPKDLGSYPNFLYIRLIFRYILSISQTEKTEELLQLFVDIAPDEKREDIIYISEHLIQKGISIEEIQGIKKGIHQGLERGKLEGKYEIVAKMLASGMNMGLIAKITGISHKKLLELSNTCNQTLKPYLTVCMGV